MILLPDEITKKDFSTVLRGYDRQEVDDFLKQVAASYRGAIEKIALVATGNHSVEDFRDELDLILLPARESAAEIVRSAAAKSAAMHKAAARRAAELESEASERAKRIIEEAEESATSRLEESRRDAGRSEQESEGLGKIAAGVAREHTSAESFPKANIGLRRLGFRDVIQSARRRGALSLMSFFRALVVGILIAEIIYLLTPYSQ